MGEGLNKIIFKNNPTILKYVPHRHRATYLDSHDLRSSTPTPYVPQRLAARACLEAQLTTFGGSIHYVWRLNSLRLEAPFTTFGGSIHYVWKLHSLRLEAPNALVQAQWPCLISQDSEYNKNKLFKKILGKVEILTFRGINKRP